MVTVDPGWALGYPLHALRRYADAFRAHAEGYAQGRYSTPNEAEIARARHAGQFHIGPYDTYVIAYRLSSSSRWRDYRGEVALTLPRGAVIVKAAAGPDAWQLASLIGNLGWGAPAVGWKRWAGHPTDATAEDILGFEGYGTAIGAASDVWRIVGRGPLTAGPAPGPAEVAGLAELDVPVNDSAYLKVTAAAQAATDWAAHYSHYNLRRSWEALTLRGYSDDPTFIIKPAEMSRRWKAEHPEALGWQLRWTALGASIAGPLTALLDALPVDNGEALERVRLMRLKGGGGLARHSDITDREAGVADGKIARLHLPLTTSPGCVFTSWGLDGQPTELHMAAGRWYYLDVRKPHACRNEGPDRTHLVADIQASPQLRALLEEAQAP